jgi:hypothetical protein
MVDLCEMRDTCKSREEKMQKLTLELSEQFKKSDEL